MMAGAWEIADRDHPERAGSRFTELGDAARALDKCQVGERFYLRWVTPTSEEK